MLNPGKRGFVLSTAVRAGEVLSMSTPLAPRDAMILHGAAFSKFLSTSQHDLSASI